MCLLMVTMGALPKREYLVNASVNNPDGYGFAVNHGDRIVTGRSMKYENLLDRFYHEMAQSKSPVGMFHARYTTHGKTMLENNHPFRVDGRKDIVLAHNGMLPITPREGDVRSDTRIFAEDILGSIGVQELDDKDTFSRLEYLSSGSKIAILSTAPELRDSVYILNENLGHWEGDIWWSNSGYKSIYSSGFYGYGGWYSEGKVLGYQKHWWEDPADDYVIKSTQAEEESIVHDTIDVCGVCESFVSPNDGRYGICNWCQSCLDCSEHVANCLCYTPQSSLELVHSPLDYVE